MDETREVAKRLGSSIKVALEESGLSVLALHKRTGISRETIYRILRGQALPTLDVLLRVAHELEISPGALIDGHLVKKAGASETKRSSEAKEVGVKLAELQSRIELLERRRHPPK